MRILGLPLCLLLVLVCQSVRADERPLHAIINERVAAGWNQQQLVPAELSTDHEFQRRVYLDLIGTIPSHDETVQFLNDASSRKREELIDRLLEDPRYSQHQADIWDMVYFGRNPPGHETDRRAGFQRWLKDQFANNTPYDQWARQILKANGNTVDEGAPMFLVQYRNQPEDASEAVSQIFLGVQLQCARCHDHPYEPWKQVDFYGMAAFLSRLDVVNVGKKDELNMYAIGEKSTGDILFTGPASQATPGKKGDPVKPKFLLGDALTEPAVPEGFKEVKFEDKKPPTPPLFSRKDQLADWITDSSRNPYFARAIANRVWAQFLGRGLVHPVDNMSPSNKPSHPELLDELTAALVEHRFDLKWYIRELCLSRPYQLSSRGSTGEPLPRYFEHGRSRPLSAEELVDGWRVATRYEMPEQSSGKKQSPGRFHPLEAGFMLKFFGQPNSGTGDFQGGLQEHLYLNNGPLGNVIQSGKGSFLESLTDASKPIESRVQRLFLAVLSRPPAEDEQARFIEFLAADKQQERWRTAVWVLLTCSEFRFNH